MHKKCTIFFARSYMNGCSWLAPETWRHAWHAHLKGANFTWQRRRRSQRLVYELMPPWLFGHNLALCWMRRSFSCQASRHSMTSDLGPSQMVARDAIDAFSSRNSWAACASASEPKMRYEWPVASGGQRHATSRARTSSVAEPRFNRELAERLKTDSIERVNRTQPPALADEAVHSRLSTVAWTAAKQTRG